MAGKERRLGGRSARIQAAVHKAVEDLSAAVDRSTLTVPQIAAQAGVTPSTIYRRWGSLADLLADVAVRRLRPIADPTNTGALKSDLQAWTEQFMEEMSSPVGRAMIRDANVSETSACQCSGFTYDHLATITARAASRGERSVAVDDLIDQIVAPIMYRILYGSTPLTIPYCHRLIERALIERR